jgi:hypothetical protein
VYNNFFINAVLADMRRLLMKIVKVGICAIGLASVVMSANAATPAPSQALTQCTAAYKRLGNQTKIDKPAIQKAVMNVFKNTKDKQKLKTQITAIATKYLKSEFSIMKGADTLNSCAIAAKAGKTDAYVPLMTAYMADGDVANAQLWCKKAAADKLKNAGGQVIQPGVCAKIPVAIRFFKS